MFSCFAILKQSFCSQTSKSISRWRNNCQWQKKTKTKKKKRLNCFQPKMIANEQLSFNKKPFIMEIMTMHLQWFAGSREAFSPWNHYSHQWWSPSLSTFNIQQHSTSIQYSNKEVRWSLMKEDIVICLVFNAPFMPLIYVLDENKQHHKNPVYNESLWGALEILNGKGKTIHHSFIQWWCIRRASVQLCLDERWASQPETIGVHSCTRAIWLIILVIIYGLRGEAFSDHDQVINIT